MNLDSKYLSWAVLAAALCVTVGCRSNSDQASNQNTPGAQAGAGAAAGSATPAGNAASAGPAVSPGAPVPTNPAAAPVPQAPRPPAAVTLLAGTELRVRLDDDLGSKISEPGEAFTATVSDDVVVDGQTVIPRGARADGTVVDAKPLGKFKGGAVLAVRLDRVHTNWGSYPVETSSISRAENGKGKRTGIMAGGGAGLGALIGGLAGGKKGALIGGLAGAGAGTAGSAFTGNKQIVLPAETLLTFRLEKSVQVVQKQ